MKDVQQPDFDGEVIFMGHSAIHPGEHHAEQLEALDMSAAELSRKLKMPTDRITEILNGKRAITSDTALRLPHCFGTSAEFWMTLQKRYGLRLAEQKAEEAETPREHTWHG